MFGRVILQQSINNKVLAEYKNRIYGGSPMKQSYLLGAACACLVALVSSATFASPAKFNIPGDFPGTFQIDFLATDFFLGGQAAGGLSTASTIQFSVGSETSPGSGIYNTSISPGGFSFLGFFTSGITFDVYGAGTGTGTFDTNTGDWEIDMPTLWVNSNPDGTAYGTRLDYHLTTQNILIPASGSNPAYMTTTATPMVIDESSPEPWGDLNLVAGGIVPNSTDLQLVYDFNLIDSIGNNYTYFLLDNNPFVGVQYEFNIYGNDPIVETVPIPAAVWLFSSGMLGLIGIARRGKSG